MVHRPYVFSSVSCSHRGPACHSLSRDVYFLQCVIFFLRGCVDLYLLVFLQNLGSMDRLSLSFCVGLFCSGAFTRCLFRIEDPFFFSILTFIVSVTFDSSWNFSTFLQLNEQLVLQYSHMSQESRNQTKQLVGTGGVTSMKNYSKKL